MRVMTITERSTNVLFTVSYGENEFRAVQLLDRIGKDVYAQTTLEVGDLVLVEEVPQFLRSPSMSKGSPDSVSHVIIGLVPPSECDEIQNYNELVKRI